MTVLRLTVLRLTVLRLTTVSWLLATVSILLSPVLENPFHGLAVIRAIGGHRILRRLFFLAARLLPVWPLLLLPALLRPRLLGAPLFARRLAVTRLLPARISAIAVAFLTRLFAALLSTLLLGTLVTRLALVLPALSWPGRVLPALVIPRLALPTLPVLPPTRLILPLSGLLLSGLPIARSLAATGLLLILRLLPAFWLFAIIRLILVLRRLITSGLLATARLLASSVGLAGLLVFAGTLATIFLVVAFAIARLVLWLGLRLAGRRPFVDDQRLPRRASLVGPLRPGVDGHAAILERRSRLSPTLPWHEQRPTLEEPTLLLCQEDDLLPRRTVLEPHLQPHSGEAEVGVDRPHPNLHRRVGRHPQGRLCRLLERNLRGHVGQHLDPMLQVFRDQLPRSTGRLTGFEEQPIRSLLSGCIEPQVERHRGPRRIAGV